MRYSSLASADGTKFHTPEAHSSFGLNRFQYKINKLSKAEKEHVLVRIKPSNFTDWEKKKPACAWKCCFELSFNPMSLTVPVWVIEESIYGYNQGNFFS